MLLFVKTYEGSFLFFIFYFFGRAQCLCLCLCLCASVFIFIFFTRIFFIFFLRVRVFLFLYSYVFVILRDVQRRESFFSSFFQTGWMMELATGSAAYAEPLVFVWRALSFIFSRSVVG